MANKVWATLAASVVVLGSLSAWWISKASASSDLYTSDGNSWSNTQDHGVNQPPGGPLNDIAIGGNNGSQQVSAVQIYDPAAANNYGSGSYVYTTVQEHYGRRSKLVFY